MSDTQVASLETRGYTLLERAGAGAAELFKFRVPSGLALGSARAEILTINPESAADFNHYYRAGAEVCTGVHCMGPRLIRWPGGPDVSSGCAVDVRIGLIDTGINPKHETFAGGRLEVIDAPVDGRQSSRQHGTAVAALLLGSADSRSPGLLPNATVIALDVFYRTRGNDERTDAFSLVKAMAMLADRRISILNLSLAGPPNALLERSVMDYAEAGITIVAAAGNGGPKAEPAYPGAYPLVIAVTAIDRNMKIYRRAGRGDHIDFAAPGVEVWTAASIRGARTKTGTSFAVPFVTAAVALAQSGEAVSDPETIKSRLAAGAHDLGAPGKDPVFGHGLVQANGLCDPRG